MYHVVNIGVKLVRITFFFDENLEWWGSVAMDNNPFDCSYFFNNQEK